MYCIQCGKQNVDNAKFCAFCGTSTVPAESQKTNEWEYDFYSRYWELNEGGRWNLNYGFTEHDARLDNWSSDQDSVMPNLQEYLDDGWVYVSPPGPNSYRFNYHTGYHENSGGKYTWLSVSSFVVDFRRPARPLKSNEKKLLGSWQETVDPNNGLWNKVGNVVFSQRLSVEKATLEFRKDHTFSFQDRTKRGNGLQHGVFYENENGLIDINYKYIPDFDTTIKVGSEKIILNYNRPEEYERVNSTAHG